MSAPETGPDQQSEHSGRRKMAFRRTRMTSPPTRDQSRRQTSVVQSVWRHFGEPGPVIAFLNTRHALLGGEPLRLAIASDEGLGRVEALLEQLPLKA